MDREYGREIDAAFALLEDVTAILNRCGVDFVVVGGWVPYLFHSDRFGHPGTYDIDILLNEPSLDDRTFESAGEMLLAEGYLRAVKNRFQAHKIIRVNGEDLVFHADFLNERHPGDELNLISTTGKLQSIYTPPMKAVFRYANYRNHPKIPGVRFPSVETFIATKAEAATVKKRPRDAFDVFVSVADQEPSALKERWQKLMRDGLFRDANDNLWKAVNEGDAIKKIGSVLDELSTEQRPSREEIRQTFEFLLDPVK
jgi:hypothetical protein